MDPHSFSKSEEAHSSFADIAIWPSSPGPSGTTLDASQHYLEYAASSLVNRTAQIRIRVRIRAVCNHVVHGNILSPGADCALDIATREYSENSADDLPLSWDPPPLYYTPELVGLTIRKLDSPPIRFPQVPYDTHRFHCTASSTPRVTCIDSAPFVPVFAPRPTFGHKQSRLCG